jgi:hypothetical protein
MGRTDHQVLQKKALLVAWTSGEYFGLDRSQMALLVAWTSGEYFGLDRSQMALPVWLVGSCRR